ncbi:MAG TPA: hypothetical protein VGV61_10590 [Thermoanaerobaculia bacterium]|jgi:thiamine phosphate synthase YjbQ (UPF0047 family)|nr:hypothetical protein [Thermoanaerobaculia bacterium]
MPRGELFRPVEVTVRLQPQARYDVIDVRGEARAQHGAALDAFPRGLYCSYHTTAGYLEQSLVARLRYSREYVDPYIQMFQRVFPAGAPYQHDQLDLRSELSEEEKRRESRNADSHLAYIGSGLRNCATYVHRDDQSPVPFIDLDGVVPGGHRERRTTVFGYHREEAVASWEVALPVSPHPVDSLNLRDPRVGFLEQLADVVRRHGVEQGRVDVALLPSERHVGLTVNEYETLLMQHDLAEVLREPLRFMAAKGRNMLRDPRAIPSKTLNYAKYDLVQLFNEAMDHLHISESALERLLSRCLALPAARFLRMKRSLSLPISAAASTDGLLYGTYQSPILVQWRKAEGLQRRVRVNLVRFR